MKIYNMKKLLSLLTITALTASVPAPLLANTVQTRVKSDVGTTAKDVTTGFEIKTKEKLDNWKKVSASDNLFKNIDNKYYFVVWHGLFSNEWKISKFNNNAEQIKISTISTWLMKNFGDLTVGYGANWKHWKKDNGTYFKAVYRWGAVGEPQTPEIDSNGNITNWNIDKTLFQQGISFSLADGLKTATWSNAGVRLTVDGETNINIDNPNVTEVLWNGVKQNMLGGKVNINVKPESTEKTHKLVIKYDIRGKKYTSEDIDVVMAAKIEPAKQIVKENLSDMIKFDNNNDLGNILDNNDDTIKAEITNKNSRQVDFSQIEITDKTDIQTTLSAIEGSKSYAGSVIVKYNIVPATVVDLKIDVTSSANGVQIVKDYLAQLDSSKMTNPVDTFYYANGKSTIKIKQPPTGNVITGTIYGCDEQWNKTSHSSAIDPINGLEIDKGQYGSVDGRYLIELQHQDLPTHKKTIYLQVSEKQKVEHYWDTPNGKQFEQWAQDQEQGYDNIRGSSAGQLNNLFEVSKTWKQNLKHLDLKLDNFVVDNIKNVTQDEIDTYKTKMLASVKAQVEKYAPNVVENTDYVISVDNLIVGDWTTSKDVKVQSVSGSTKLLSFTVKTIPAQQKKQPNPITPNPEPTPVNNKKTGLGIWAIFGIVVGSLLGLFVLGWLFKRFVINPFILKPIRDKKEKAFVAKTEKDIAQMKIDDEEWEAKQKGDK
ncbi:adhesin [Spiroplasma sp. Moj]|uniref:adhesin n=1 Tax=Spiroplasma sp. Moj TaxID=1922342 RepID=UPI0039EEA727|nr:adhesin [Spiroplasma sp. Moj]